MLRTALRPRWLALFVVVLLAATGMAFLGQWQLERAHLNGRGPAERAERARVNAVPTPLDRVLAPRQTFPKGAVNTRVSVTGRWDGAHLLLVAGRRQHGRDGFWVLLPLRLADGSAVPVVRGWVATPGDPAAGSASGAGPVTVVGLLQPTEPAVPRAPGQTSGLPTGQLERVSAPELVNTWPYPLITGFVVEQAERPASPPLPQAVPPPAPADRVDLLNLSYAVQWWLFAGFGLWLWWRLVRDEHLGRSGSRPPDPEPVSTVQV